MSEQREFVSLDLFADVDLGGSGLANPFSRFRTRRRLKLLCLSSNSTLLALISSLDNGKAEVADYFVVC